jgi:hypothetical protein
MGFLDWLEHKLGIDGYAAEERRVERALVNERRQEVQNVLAEKIERDARNKIARGEGDAALLGKGKAELELAHEVRRGGEAALLVAMGVLGREKD